MSNEFRISGNSLNLTIDNYKDFTNFLEKKLNASTILHIEEIYINYCIFDSDYYSENLEKHITVFQTACSELRKRVVCDFNIIQTMPDICVSEKNKNKVVKCMMDNIYSGPETDLVSRYFLILKNRNISFKYNKMKRLKEICIIYIKNNNVKYLHIPKLLYSP